MMIVSAALAFALTLSLSQAATAAEVEAAAAYFAALKPGAIIKVVETDTVPKTFVFGWHLAAMKTGEREAIGQRGRPGTVRQPRRAISFYRLRSAR
jgi:hypothetical protein